MKGKGVIGLMIPYYKGLFEREGVVGRKRSKASLNNRRFPLLLGDYFLCSNLRLLRYCILQILANLFILHILTF